METVSFISQCLSQAQLRLLASCEGLTRDQVLWRPAPSANNIGFILWHVARAEDGLITRMSGNQRALWVSEEWHKKFDQPVDAPDPGDRMGLRSLAIPELKVLNDYSRAAHQRAQSFIRSLTAEGLDEAPDPSKPELTVAGWLRHMITHKNNHHGQVDYIRGLQDQTWDLPPGTGQVLPQSA